MTLAAGTCFGPYEIVSPLGAGGMGEIYRRRDGRLGRDVALKVLPRQFADDRDRLMRFEREARTLAALNHPHIAAIYGVEVIEPTVGVSHPAQALVLELVEGDTLAERIQTRAGRRRSGLPVAEALTIARQVADALDAAHEKGRPVDRISGGGHCYRRFHGCRSVRELEAVRRDRFTASLRPSRLSSAR